MKDEDRQGAWRTHPPEPPQNATMADVCIELGVTYTEDGVATYLASPNADFNGSRPIELCATAEGRQRVWGHAHNLAGRP